MICQIVKINIHITYDQSPTLFLHFDHRFDQALESLELVRNIICPGEPISVPLAIKSNYSPSIKVDTDSWDVELELLFFVLHTFLYKH